MLAGGLAPLVARARHLLEEGDLEVARHLAEWAVRAEPTQRTAQELKRDVYERSGAETINLMAQGIYRAAMNEARAALGEERVRRSGRVTL
jgi:alkyl sulfatase BDS1-like metallo-beta-lactamase superfamily hydrolase